MLVKAIPTIMGPLAERAIRRAATITRRARRVALAFHQKTSPFDGMTGFVPLDDSALTAEDVGRLLGARENSREAGRPYVVPGAAGAFVRENTTRGRGRPPLCRCIPRSDLEDALRRKSFSAFRSECKHGEIKLHDCLFVIPYSMSTNRPGLNGTAQLLSYSTVKRYLKEHFGEPAWRASSTVEAGDAGEGRTVTSHMFRMWLGTEAPPRRADPTQPFSLAEPRGRHEGAILRPPPSRGGGRPAALAPRAARTGWTEGATAGHGRLQRRDRGRHRRARHGCRRMFPRPPGRPLLVLPRFRRARRRLRPSWTSSRGQSWRCCSPA